MGNKMPPRDSNDDDDEEDEEDEDEDLEPPVERDNRAVSRTLKFDF
jgi:hypothetical protein